jgi:hypothetical protein
LENDQPLAGSDQPAVPSPPADADESLSLADHETRFGPNRSQQAQAQAEPDTKPAETPPAEPDVPESGTPETADRDEKGRFLKSKTRHTAPKDIANREDVPRIHALSAQLRQARAELERLRTQSAPTVPRDIPTAPAVQATPKPTSDQFQDYGEYIEALTDWKTDQKLTAAETKRAEAERQRTAQAEQQRLQSSWSERVTAAKTKYPDFEDVALLTETAIPQGSLIDGWILEHKAGADVLYHLQKNPDQLHDLLALPLFEQAEQLALLSQRMNGSTRTQTVATGSAAAPVSTPAPRPPNPVRTGPIRSSDEPPGDDASLADHERFYVPRRRRGA